MLEGRFVGGAGSFPRGDIEGFEYFLAWFDRWRLSRGLEIGREATVAFWREQVRAKERLDWQLDQWAEAVRWLLRWREICDRKGLKATSIPERVRNAMESAGARRGLAKTTRKTYRSWAVRFASWAGSAERVMSEACASEWLGILVEKEQVSFPTQKQALNALVFFFKDVCGREEVVLDVKMKKGKRRMPIVLTKEEIQWVLDKLEPVYRLPAEVQYGSGLRLSELVRLRVKDVDLDRGLITVRGGKGDRDRVTMLPLVLREKLAKQLTRTRRQWELDRENGVPAVALPGALARKFPNAGNELAWQWVFPAAGLSKDPESGLVRRHHLHEKVYAAAVRRAAEQAGLSKQVTTHAFRHSFATHLLEAGADIRTLQELLGHEDVKTTEIYAHASQIGNSRGGRSPLDGLGGIRRECEMVG